MKLRTLVIVVVTLAALSALVFFVNRPPAPVSTDPLVGKPLADPALIEKAAKIRFSEGGKSVTLVRQPDNTWKVPSYYDMTADFAKLSGFITSLTDAKVQRLVTARPDSMARLEFKDTKIDLLDASDQALWSVTLGKNAETGSGRFIQFGSEPKAFLANLNAYLDTEPKNWANAEFLNVKAEDVAKIEIPFAEGGPVTLSRTKKDDAWTSAQTPANQKVKADKVLSVLSSVGSLRFSDTNELTDPNVTAAKANLRTFKLTTFDNKTVTVAFGRKPEEKKLKPPADGKSGPGSLGSIADLAKKDSQAKDANGKATDPAKPLAPEFETIPAGPVFALVTHSDSSAPINTLMQKRAFQIPEYAFTGLPQKADELFESNTPPPSPTSPPASTPKPAPAHDHGNEAKKAP